MHLPLSLALVVDAPLLSHHRVSPQLVFTSARCPSPVACQISCPLRPVRLATAAQMMCSTLVSAQLTHICLLDSRSSLAQTTLTVVMMPCQDFQGITAFLLALSCIDRQDRFTIFTEILDLSLSIARLRADLAGKHPCAPAIDASSPSLAIDSFARL